MSDPFDTKGWWEALKQQPPTDYSRPEKLSWLQLLGRVFVLEAEVERLKQQLEETKSHVTREG